MRTHIIVVLGSVLSACAASESQDSGPGEPPEPGRWTFGTRSFPSEPPTTARVEVTLGGSPVEGIEVVFHDGTGSVTAQQTTSADGGAVATVGAGAMVSVVRLDGSVRRLVTVMGVDPGDEVAVELDEAVADPTFGSARVSLPGGYSGASRYTIDVGCARTSTTNANAPRTLDLRASCVGTDGAAHVFATAWDGAGAAVAWSFADLTASAGATTSVSMPAWSADWRPVSISLAAAPEGARYVQSSGEWLVDFESFAAADQPAAFVSAGQGVTLTTRVPGVAAEGFVGRVTIAHGTDSSLTGFTERVERSSAVPSATTLGMTSDFLPAVTASSLDAATDPARPSVSWTTAGGFEAADLGRVELVWRADGVDHVWRLVVPPETQAPVVAPALPDALVEYRPGAAASFAVPQVFFHDADWIDGYGGVKAVGFEPALPDGPHVLVTSAALNPQ